VKRAKEDWDVPVAVVVGGGNCGNSRGHMRNISLGVPRSPPGPNTKESRRKLGGASYH
jgi:hypothetical protein